MIDLFNGYKIDADDKTFILRKDRKNSRDEIVSDALGYYPTIQQTIEAVYKFDARKLSNKKKLTLEETVAELDKIADKVVKATNKLGKIRFSEVNTNE